MDKKKVKKIIACILCIAVVAVPVLIADTIIKQNTTDGIKQGLSVYDQPRDTVDLLVLGSSHVYYGVNTAKLWEDYGISSFVFGSAEQSLWVSYHYMIEACKTQKPKVVVLDFFSPAAFQDDHKFKYAFLADSLYGIKFSLNKLLMMQACFDGDIELWNKYFPSFFGYHDQYDSVNADDLGKLFEDHSAFKGYDPHYNMHPTEMFRIGNFDSLPPSDKSVKYLQKIVDYTAKHDMELYITIVPYKLNVQQGKDSYQQEDKRYNWLREYVAGLPEKGYNHVRFDYTLEHMDSFGLLMGIGEDMYDETHLNYYGSCKYTDYLGKDLRNLYGTELLPDHRGDPDYYSWDENLENIKNDVESHGFEWR